MSNSRVPEEIKQNVRAVLLSKIGGVLVSEFRKDYKKLVNSRLFIENYGFNNYKDFIESMPGYARLEYSDKDMAYRLFGVADPDMYMSLAAKKAQGNVPRGNRGPERNGAPSATDEPRRLVPNSRGLYTVCFPIEKARSTESDAILELFSQAGEVGEVHTTTKWVFVRFKTEQGALSSLKKLSNLGVRIADEGKNRQKAEERPMVAATEDESESFLVNKFSSAREKNNVSPETMGGKKGALRGDKENEVFVGNIANTVTDEEFKKYINHLNSSYCRLVRKDLKLYAFLGFHNLQNASVAVQELDGEEINGRRIQARLANPAQTSSTQNSSTQNSYSQMKQVSPTSNESASAGRRLMQLLMNGENKMDATHHARPGLLGPSPTMMNSAGDASNSALNKSFESNNSLSSGSVKLADRLTDLSISIDRSGKKVITSTPISRTTTSPPQVPPISSRSREDTLDEMPQLEESMPHLEDSVLETESEPEEDNKPVELFVANFPMQTTARELYGLFFRFKVLNVNICPPMMHKCPKAYVLLPNLLMAAACLRDMNQIEYMGRPLLIDVPRNTPEIKEKIMALSSSYKGGNSSQFMSPPNRVSRSAMLEGLCPEALDDISVSSGSDRNIEDILEIYTHIMEKTKSRKNFLAKGSCVKVLITAADEENFFWGQVVTEKREKQLALRHLVKDLQNTENHLDKMKSLGRCAALYQGEWHRAWVLKASMKPQDLAKVFFVDYGNVEKVTFTEMCRVGPRFWELPPLAMPFRVAGPGWPDLDSLENCVVECEVIQTCPVGRAMLTEVIIVDT